MLCHHEIPLLKSAQVNTYTILLLFYNPTLDFYYSITSHDTMWCHQPFILFFKTVAVKHPTLLFSFLPTSCPSWKPPPQNPFSQTLKTNGLNPKPWQVLVTCEFFLFPKQVPVNHLLLIQHRAQFWSGAWCRHNWDVRIVGPLIKNTRSISTLISPSLIPPDTQNRSVVRPSDGSHIMIKCK